MKITLRPMLLGAAAALAALAPNAAAQLENFSLVQGVPSDYFLVTGSRHAPEADFIDAHWARVGDAFRESEILEDLMDMVSENAPPEEMEMMTAMFEQYATLFGAVDWDAMGNEFVFGERLNTPVILDNGATFGPPDFIFLMKMDPETADANYAALMGLFNTGFAQINAMTGAELAFGSIKEHGFQFSVLDFAQLTDGQFDYPISIGHKDGVLAVTMGSGVRSEMTTLLAGEGQIRSIASTERFKNAFDGLPTAELGFSYFDMINMRGNMEDIFSMVSMVLDRELAMTPAPGETADMTEEQMIVDMVNHAMELAYDAMSLIEGSGTVTFVRGHSIHAVSRAMLADGVESNPFFPLIGTVQPVEDFAKYLPESTTSYSVSGAVDAEKIYDFIIELVRGFGPMGEMGIGEWEAMQEDLGFDVRRDVISMLGGESISVTFNAEGKEQWVTRMAVADEESAREKIELAAAMIPELMREAAKENAMFNMLGILVRDSRDERFEGFKRLDVTMMGVSALVGVKDGWLMFGSSGDALALTDEVAAGRAPNVRSNEALMGRALIPDGPVQAASFSDYSGIAEEFSGALMMFSSMGGMMTANIPNAEDRRMANRLISMVGRLAPVIAEIDFYDSGSVIASFDGKGWMTHSVTNYKAPRKADAGE